MFFLLYLHLLCYNNMLKILGHIQVCLLLFIASDTLFLGLKASRMGEERTLVSGRTPYPWRQGATQYPTWSHGPGPVWGAHHPACHTPEPLCAAVPQSGNTTHSHTNILCWFNLILWLCESTDVGQLFQGWGRGTPFRLGVNHCSKCRSWVWGSCYVRIKLVCPKCRKSNLFIVVLANIECCLNVGISGGRSWKTFIVWHSVVHMKTNRNSCITNFKKESQREKTKSSLLSHRTVLGKRESFG